MAKMSDEMAANLRKLSTRQVDMLNALTGFAIALDGQRLAPKDLLGIDMEELAGLIAVLLGGKDSASGSRASRQPLPSDEGASAVQFDVINLLQPWWREQKQKA